VDSMRLNVHHSPFVRREIRYMIYTLYMGRKTAGGGRRRASVGAGEKSISSQNSL
jgi:hypothetical protein